MRSDEETVVLVSGGMGEDALCVRIARAPGQVCISPLFVCVDDRLASIVVWTHSSLFLVFFFPFSIAPHRAKLRRSLRWRRPKHQVAGAQSRPSTLFSLPQQIDPLLVAAFYTWDAPLISRSLPLSLSPILPSGIVSHLPSLPTKGEPFL